MISPLTQPAVLFTCLKKQLIDFSHPCKHCISMVMASIPYLQWADRARGRRGAGLLILLALLRLCQPSSRRRQIREPKDPGLASKCTENTNGRRPKDNRSAACSFFFLQAYKHSDYYSEALSIQLLSSPTAVFSPCSSCGVPCLL